MFRANGPRKKKGLRLGWRCGEMKRMLEPLGELCSSCILPGHADFPTETWEIPTGHS